MRAALSVSASFSASPASASVGLLPLTTERTYPAELATAVARGAVVVDIRTSAERTAQGTLPGALAIDSSLLTRRLDPAGPERLALAVDRDVEWVVVSADGPAAHRSVAALQELGLRRATGLVGGYAAIRTAGLVDAVTRARHIAEDVARVTAH
ncbi:rhodanese-like domain-containing protein [Rhodococcus phenolicus]|uniref:rhodanese-like domain-containing protein n=1 Tax=Rhodococcus phenolicus TaxID=263849 RepID=UPI0008376787|nr:rhodanese-like domain-containing protein [Rhodococcus phenolicus]